jgi:hypothetical protein
MPDIDVAQDVTSHFEQPIFSIKAEPRRQLDTTRNLFVEYSEKDLIQRDTIVMTANKMYHLEKPDDRARKLASQLSLEEQVGCNLQSLPLVTAFPGKLLQVCRSERTAISAHPCQFYCLRFISFSTAPSLFSHLQALYDECSIGQTIHP